MKHLILARLLPAITLLMATAEVLLAQPGSGGPAPGGNTATAIPLDGGATLLLAGGVAYGIKHLRDRRKQKARF